MRTTLRHRHACTCTHKHTHTYTHINIHIHTLQSHTHTHYTHYICMYTLMYIHTHAHAHTLGLSLLCSKICSLYFLEFPNFLPIMLILCFLGIYYCNKPCIMLTIYIYDCTFLIMIGIKCELQQQLQKAL